MPDPLLAVNYTWYGYDLTPADGSRRIQVVEGLRAGGPLRGEDRPIPGLPGADPYPREAGPLPLLLAGHVEGLGATQEAKIDAFEATARALLALIRPSRTPGPLVATFRSGLVLTTQARAVDAISWGDQALPFRKLTLPAISHEGHWYGDDVTDAGRAIAASPTAFALEHPGDEETHAVTLDFTGPITNPRVTNLTTDTYVECLVGVAAGEHLVIDGAAFTALNNAVNAIGSIRHSGDRRWLVIAPGTNNLQVSASVPGGTLTTTFRTPYL